jgi:hypothetical protein
MNLESAVMTNRIVGGVVALKSGRLSYRVYGSHDLGEVLNRYVLGSTFGALVGIFFHGLKLLANV